MNISRIASLGALIIVSGCTAVGHQFCLGSGYAEDSPQYNQCISRYQTSPDLYEYCQQKRGIAQEGGQLNQCLESGRRLRDNYSQDGGFCQNEASRKFAGILSQPKREKQATLQDNGALTIDEVPTGTAFAPGEDAGITAPFVQQCLQAHGWNNGGAWQDGKRAVSIGEVTGALSRLNSQPLVINLPENPSVRLFVAVANGNADLVRQLITREGMNVNTQNYQGYTPLHVAARQGNFQISQMLLEQLNANPDMMSYRGENAMTMASRGPNPGLANYMLELVRKKERERATLDAQNALKEALKQQNAPPPAAAK